LDRKGDSLDSLYWGSFDFGEQKLEVEFVVAVVVVVGVVVEV